MTPLDTIFQSDFDLIIKQTQRRKLPPKTAFERQSPPVSATQNRKDIQNQGLQKKDYVVGQVFRPLILVSKWMCSCPVKITRHGDEILYTFHWLSAQFLTTFAVGAGGGLLLVTWILNSIYNLDVPLRIFRPSNTQGGWLNQDLFKGSQLIFILDNLIKTSLPVGAWISIVLSWADIGSLCDFLNNWPSFIRSFNVAFASYYTSTFRLARVRNISVAFWLAPVLLLMVIMSPVQYLQGVPIIVNRIFVYLQIIIMLGTRSVSYVKDFLLLKTIMAAYSETLKGMRAEYAQCGKGITREQVRTWMDLLGVIREQAVRAESHMSVHNLWSVFEIFTSVLLILSMAIFLFMNNVLTKGISGNFLPFSLISTIFFLCSLFWKTEIAEQIANKEEEIAEELIEMETADDDCETRLEMKLICDLIYNDPIKIQVGRVITLNKRLLLSFFSQLASYLVVILQFTKS